MSASAAVIEQARMQFLDGGQIPSPLVVRPPILDSWKRSMLHGLRAAQVRPHAMLLVEHDNQVLRAARPIIENRAELLSEVRSGITLTNSQGCVLDRWVVDPAFQRRLDSRGVIPGSGLAESDIGTSSSGIALETGKSVMVVGAEHFADGAIQMSTAGAPIRHPSTRHLVGTLNLTCDQRDTTPLMLYWVREMATLIEASILDVASATEQVLMSTYLRGNRDSRHPVICMNEHTIVGNAAAIRMLGDLEQSVLWEAASEAVSSGQQREVGPITTAAGESVSLTCKPIAGETTAVGAELRLTRLGRKGREAAVPAHETKALGLPGLAGRSAAWQRFCSQVRTVEGEPLAVIGEPGTGKTATLRSLAGPRATVLLDAGKPRSERAWSELVGAALRSECEFLLLENLHLLDADDLAATIRFVAGRPADAPRVIASYTYDAVDEMNPNVTHRLEDFPGVVVRIPPLRERVGDLPLLLQALTTARTGMKVAPAWTSEAVQTLGRVQWIANVASLSRVVNLTLRGPVKPFVRYEDLPPAIRSAATRRTLSGLDYLEAHAIAAALVAADGNKKLAADRLGIARSTLYRKVRALGIDLSGTAY